MGVEEWERIFRERGNTYTTDEVGKGEQGSFWGWKYSEFLEQMYVNGDEAEVGSGSQRALGCRPEQSSCRL